MNLAAALYDYAADASPTELQELGLRCVELAQHSFDAPMTQAYLRMAQELVDLAHEAGHSLGHTPALYTYH